MVKTTPNKEAYFEQTSNGSYDRHKYHLVFKDGRVFVFEDYDTLRAFWFQNSAMKQLSHVNVIDSNKNSK